MNDQFAQSTRRAFLHYLACSPALYLGGSEAGTVRRVRQAGHAGQLAVPGALPDE